MKLRRLVSVLFLMSMMFLITTASFAASSSKTFTSSAGTTGSMSLYLDPNKSASSSIATINVSGLPTNAIITKIVADCNTMSYSGAVISNRLYIKTSNMNS